MRGRKLVRAPHTSFISLCSAQGIRAVYGYNTTAVGYWFLHWAVFDNPDSHMGDTVADQRKDYDVAISMALSDEAGE